MGGDIDLDSHHLSKRRFGCNATGHSWMIIWSVISAFLSKLGWPRWFGLMIDDYTLFFFFSNKSIKAILRIFA